MAGVYGGQTTFSETIEVSLTSFSVKYYYGNNSLETFTYSQIKLTTLEIKPFGHHRPTVKRLSNRFKDINLI